MSPVLQEMDAGCTETHPSQCLPLSELDDRR